MWADFELKNVGKREVRQFVKEWNEKYNPGLKLILDQCEKDRLAYNLYFFDAIWSTKYGPDNVGFVAFDWVDRKRKIAKVSLSRCSESFISSFRMDLEYFFS